MKIIIANVVADLEIGEADLKFKPVFQELDTVLRVDLMRDLCWYAGKSHKDALRDGRVEFDALQFRKAFNGAQRI